MPDLRLSPHFLAREFACKCCSYGTHPGDVDPRLVADLEALRVALGKPVLIVSGCRCRAYNDRCGGARSSQHLLGTAADVRVEGMSPDALVAAVLLHCPTVRAGGIGTYRRQVTPFVHCDVRRNLARWNDSEAVV